MKDALVIRDIEFVVTEDVLLQVHPVNINELGVFVSSEPRPGSLRIVADDTLELTLQPAGLINNTGYTLPAQGISDVEVPPGGSLYITLRGLNTRGAFSMIGMFRTRIQIGTDPVTGRPVYANVNVPRVIQRTTIERSDPADAVPAPRGTIGDDGRW